MNTNTGSPGSWLHSNFTRLARVWVSAFVDPHRVIGMLRIRRFLADWRIYNRLTGHAKLRWRESHPCLTDWTNHTPFDAHYFYQTYWAISRITRHQPDFHVDIGSSVMFVSAVNALARLIFLDYRPLQSKLPGFTQVGGDLGRLPFADQTVPSLSCLHVIEHVGLGRYGDTLDPTGSLKAAIELARVLKVDGRLLLSTPVGRERVQFNAHRIFAPATIATMFPNLKIDHMALVDDNGIFHPQATFAQAFRCEYGCGMFELIKLS